MRQTKPCSGHLLFITLCLITNIAFALDKNHFAIIDINENQSGVLYTKPRSYNPNQGFHLIDNLVTPTIPDSWFNESNSINLEQALSTQTKGTTLVLVSEDFYLPITFDQGKIYFMEESVRFDPKKSKELSDFLASRRSIEDANIKIDKIIPLVNRLTQLKKSKARSIDKSGNMTHTSPTNLTPNSIGSTTKEGELKSTSSEDQKRTTLSNKTAMENSELNHEIDPKKTSISKAKVSENKDVAAKQISPQPQNGWIFLIIAMAIGIFIILLRTKDA